MEEYGVHITCLLPMGLSPLIPPSLLLEEKVIYSILNSFDLVIVFVNGIIIVKMMYTLLNFINIF